MSPYPKVECPEPAEGQWFVYLLECNDKTLYCGSTNNLIRRLHDHNAGIAAQWTKMRRPLQLIYFEAQASLIKARRREKQIKGWSYAKKLNLINQSFKNTKLSQFTP
jgi:putative endonuclease